MKHRSDKPYEIVYRETLFDEPKVRSLAEEMPDIGSSSLAGTSVTLNSIICSSEVSCGKPLKNSSLQFYVAEYLLVRFRRNENERI